MRVDPGVTRAGTVVDALRRKGFRYDGGAAEEFPLPDRRPALRSSRKGSVVDATHVPQERNPSPAVTMARR